jgi:hypothetical protein
MTGKENKMAYGPFYVIVQRKGCDWVDLKVFAQNEMAACQTAEWEASKMDDAPVDEYFARYVRPWSAQQMNR